LCWSEAEQSRRRCGRGHVCTPFGTSANSASMVKDDDALMTDLNIVEDSLPGVQQLTINPGRGNKVERTDANLEVAFFHSWPVEFYSEILNSFVLKGLIDMTAGAGAAAIACVLDKKKYVGVCLSDTHKDSEMSNHGRSRATECEFDGRRRFWRRKASCLPNPPVLQTLLLSFCPQLKLSGRNGSKSTCRSKCGSCCGTPSRASTTPPWRR